MTSTHANQTVISADADVPIVRVEGYERLDALITD
jgi:hypothetical protein